MRWCVGSEGGHVVRLTEGAGAHVGLGKNVISQTVGERVLKAEVPADCQVVRGVDVAFGYRVNADGSVDVCVGVAGADPEAAWVASCLGSSGSPLWRIACRGDAEMQSLGRAGRSAVAGDPGADRGI